MSAEEVVAMLESATVTSLDPLGPKEAYWARKQQRDIAQADRLIEAEVIMQASPREILAEGKPGVDPPQRSRAELKRIRLELLKKAGYVKEPRGMARSRRSPMGVKRGQAAVGLVVELGLMIVRDTVESLEAKRQAMRETPQEEFDGSAP